MTALRLRSISITCDRRGSRPLAKATLCAIEIAMSHGWETASSLVMPCGCLHLFRDSAALLAAAEERGWDLSASIYPDAPANPARLH